MKLFKLYESVLAEGDIESCIKLFGHEIFGDELGGSEKNTPTEDRYHDEIKDFTDNMYGDSLTPEFIEAVKNMKACMGKYPEVLVPENTIAYRGTMIPLAYFIDEGIEINLNGPTPYIYRAKTKIQSWTTNIKTANNFGDNEHIDDFSYNFKFDDDVNEKLANEWIHDMLAENMRISFNLAYRTNPDDFMFKPKYFDMLAYHGDENELIRINNKPINVDALLKTEGQGALSRHSIELLKLVNYYINL